MFGWRKPFDPRVWADTQILKGLQALNLAARREGEWIGCGVSNLRARCVDAQISGEGRVASLIMDLQWGQNGPLLRENVADLSDDAQKAIQSAVFQWTMSVFVCACALHDPDGHPGHLANVQTQNFPDENGTGQTWRIVSSPALAFFFVPGSNEQKPPATWPFLEPVARELAQQKRLHTLKVFFMESDENRQIECSLNGVPSPEVAPLLEEFSWRQAGSAGSLRQFHLMAPVEAGGRVSG